MALNSQPEPGLQSDRRTVVRTAPPGFTYQPFLTVYTLIQCIKAHLVTKAASDQQPIRGDVSSGGEPLNL